MQTAFCPLTAVAMRSEPSQRAEMVNQLLFGDTMWVIDRQKEWLKVRLSFDGYEGWVSEKQVIVTDNLPEHDAIALEPTTIIHDGMAMTIQPGSYYNSQWLPQPGKSEGLRFAENPVAASWQFRGAPYLWGGRTMMGIDCSGLVQVAYMICGISLLRDANQQATQGVEVAFDEKKAGDLAFFVNEKGNIVHVGIVMEENMIIHASGKVRIDRLTPTGIINSETGEYSHRLCKLRRIVGS